MSDLEIDRFLASLTIPQLLELLERIKDELMERFMRMA